MLFGILLAVVGTVLILTGSSMAWRRIVARLRGCVLNSEIIDWNLVKHGPSHTGGKVARGMYQPTVRFVDPHGLQREFTLSHQFTILYIKNHPVGSKMRVLFDPKIPYRVLDTSITTNVVLPALLGSTGTLVLLIGLGVCFG